MTCPNLLEHLFPPDCDRPLARLSFWIAPEKSAAFAEEYDRLLEPILRHHGLEDSRPSPRPAPAGVHSRLFELESPAEVLSKRRTLEADDSWSDALRRLSPALTPFAPPSHWTLPRARHTGGDVLPWRLGILTSPAGPGRDFEAGTGARQGGRLPLSRLVGLPPGLVVDLLEDRQGAIWMAVVASGACRFDGACYTRFGAVDGLPSDYVVRVVEDRRGWLWFGTSEGIGVCDGTAFASLTVDDGLPFETAFPLLEDRFGHVWLSAGVPLPQNLVMVAHQDAALVRLGADGMRTFNRADGLPDDRVLCALQTRSGDLWFGTAGGACLLRDDGVVKTCTARDGLAHDWASALLEDRDGAIWFGTAANGLTRLRDGRFETLLPADFRTPNAICGILQDREGDIWVGRQGSGLVRFTDGRPTSYTVEDGLPSDVVLALLEDRRGDLWVSSIGGGLSRLHKAQATTYTVRDGLGDDGVTCAMEDSRGTLWFGTFSGVTSWDGKRFAQLDRVRAHILDIAEDTAGNLWFGTWGDGLYRYDGTSVTHFTKDDGLPGNDVRNIVPQGDGAVILSSKDLGVCRFHDGRFSRLRTGDPEVDVFLAEEVRLLFPGGAERLWLIARDGLYRLEQGRLTHLEPVGGDLADAYIRVLLEDRTGALWIGTAGLIRYDGHHFTRYTTVDGLTDDWIRWLMEDRDGRLWILAYGGGVTVYDGLVFQTLTRADGLAHNTVQDVIQDRHGDYWFATEGGVTRYRPQRTLPGIRVTDVVADRRHGPVDHLEEVAAGSLLAVEYRGRSLTTPPESMAYVYRLVGHRDDWTPTRSRRVEYADLSPGSYVFQVRAVDRDLNYSEPAEVSFRVVPDPHLQALSEALAGGAGEFVGRSPALKRIQDQLAHAALVDLNVLILGETGTGKGLAAHALHRLSKRRQGPFLPVSCGAIPSTLVESELFGHERGAFTGAHSRKLGKVELASSGTLFLDEVGDLPLEAQVKLLRLLEDRQFERVGGTRALEADVRIVAATNRNLERMVAEGTFRADLYYRLRVLEVRMPPLRDRREDIPILATYFASRMAEHLGKQVERFDPAALELLVRHPWPGNVRELEHAVQRAVIVCPGKAIGPQDLVLGTAEREDLPHGDAEIVPLKEFERRYLVSVLERVGWTIKGPSGAAALLGLPVSTLRGRMAKLGIRRPGD